MNDINSMRMNKNTMKLTFNNINIDTVEYFTN